MSVIEKFKSKKISKIFISLTSTIDPGVVEKAVNYLKSK